MFRKKEFAITLLVASLILAGGCTPASKLSGLAMQNQENITRYNTDVCAAVLLLDEFVDRSGDIFIDGRIGLFLDDMANVLGPPSRAPNHPSDWTQVLTGTKKTDYENLKATVNLSLPDDVRQSLEAAHGWLMTAAKDPSFTPTKAKEIQRTIGSLRSSLKGSGQREAYRDAASTLIATVDPAMRSHLEMVKNMRAVKDRLTSQLERHASYAQRHAAIFTQATGAAMSLDLMMQTILERDDTQGLITGLVTNQVRNENQRDALIALLKDTSILREDPTN